MDDTWPHFTEHLESDPEAPLRCDSQTDHLAGTYPVLRLGHATFFPTVAQLRKLRDVLDVYLAAEGQAMFEPTPEELERQRVATPGSVPTLAEALRNPDAFVEGMTETAETHHGLPF